MSYNKEEYRRWKQEQDAKKKAERQAKKRKELDKLFKEIVKFGDDEEFQRK